MNNSIYENVKFNLNATVVLQIAGICISGALILLLPKILGLTGYGFYTVQFSIFSIFVLVFNLGSDGLINRYVPEAIARKDYAFIRNLFFDLLLFKILLTGVVLVLVFNKISVFIIIAAFFSGIANTCVLFLYSMDYLGKRGTVEISLPFFIILTVTLSSLFVKDHIEAIPVYIAVSAGLQFVIGLLFVLRILPDLNNYKYKIGKALTFRNLFFSFKIFLANWTFFSLEHFLILSIKFQTNFRNVGILGIVIKLLTLLNRVSSHVAASSLPSFVYWVLKDKKKFFNIKDKYFKRLYFTLGLLVPLTFLLSIPIGWYFKLSKIFHLSVVNLYFLLFLPGFALLPVARFYRNIIFAFEKYFLFILAPVLAASLIGLSFFNKGLSGFKGILISALYFNCGIALMCIIFIVAFLRIKKEA